MQKNKVFFILTAILFMITFSNLSAQSNEVVDNLLLAKEAGFGETAYMIAVGSGLADESISTAEAVSIISEKKWNRQNKTAGDKITLGETSFLIMKALEMKGGIMYSLMPSPRYAVRELNYLGLLNTEPHPNRSVSGKDVLDILAEAIALKEENK